MGDEIKKDPCPICKGKGYLFDKEGKMSWCDNHKKKEVEMGQDTMDFDKKQWDADKFNEGIVRDMLVAIQEDPNRDGLQDTPKRVVKMWRELFSGYNQNPSQILSVAFDNDEHYDGIVALYNVEFYSMCEHHMLPFFGRVSLGYLPGASGKVVGISKLARLVEIFARRLQIQERMVSQIANAMEMYLKPEGIMVLVEAQHLCMKMRGVKQSGSSLMRTTIVRGRFKESVALRDEFLNGVK